MAVLRQMTQQNEEVVKISTSRNAVGADEKQWLMLMVNFLMKKTERRLMFKFLIRIKPGPIYTNFTHKILLLADYFGN